jgi:hypothetical protein
MSWTFSFSLLPEEKVIADSANNKQHVISPVYSIVLTNKRAIFRFDSLKGYLSKSFFYHEIFDAKLTKRLYINYLLINTVSKEFLFNTEDPEYWAKQIMQIKENN